jgi:hypothetical protein
MLDNGNVREKNCYTFTLYQLINYYEIIGNLLYYKLTNTVINNLKFIIYTYYLLKITYLI